MNNPETLTPLSKDTGRGHTNKNKQTNTQTEDQNETQHRKQTRCVTRSDQTPRVTQANGKQFLLLIRQPPC